MPVEGPQAWGFNGDDALPSFTPSLLVRGRVWRGVGGPENVDEYVCHSFVTNGRIEFLADCTHTLKGQTVDLPEVES